MFLKKDLKNGHIPCLAACLTQHSLKSFLAMKFGVMHSWDTNTFGGLQSMQKFIRALAKKLNTNLLFYLNFIFDSNKIININFCVQNLETNSY